MHLRQGRSPPASVPGWQKHAVTLYYKSRPGVEEYFPEKLAWLAFAVLTILSSNVLKMYVKYRVANLQIIVTYRFLCRLSQILGEEASAAEGGISFGDPLGRVK